ncbi:hypothetical protein [Desulforamulus ruminis]|uniref:Major tropism determinant N-terminal domain-containing protein n=1 Tax=Desulforamulus ruminis (strain ATCC 23193 / DSM 2154 / NCIMB 8452 / DL) TaxID=696281 RepID=F6DLP9_DESRL|nr:hypothetical protein [Desulforamulus ruminis]AEG61691.1 hypothetical protein Desru_3488 [Desulforamulus ruminis DSM 2154]
MANKIQFKRGTKANLPSLSVGEPGFCTDTKELFIGASEGNVQIVDQAQLTAHLSNGVHQVLPIPSGTAFPSNPEGKPMLFFRTDEGKLYWFSGGGA